MILASLIMVAACSVAYSADLTEAEAIKQRGFLVLLGYDWATTRDIAENCDKYHETNPAMGKCPEKNRINAYFLSVAAIHSLTVLQLSHKNRAILQNISLFLEAGYVANNYALGLRANF